MGRQYAKAASPALGYRPDIDGLRAIAVLAVVGFHAFPLWFTGGFVGVDIFFVISGFLITTILLDGLEKNTFRFIQFYAKRINRLFPALILVFLFCFIFGWLVLFPNEYKQLGSHIAGGAGFIANFLLWHNTGYFDNAAETKPLLHLWSLGIEEQFYIFWPVFIWTAAKKRGHLIILMGSITILSFLLNVREVNVNSVAAFFSPQTRFWELALGAMLAYFTFYQSSNIFIDQKSKRNRICNLFALIGLLLISISVVKFTKLTNFPGLWAFFPTAGAILLIASKQSWLNRTILSHPIMVGIGLISYPLYLWHWPLLSFAHILEDITPSRTIRLTAVAISFLLAWFTYRFIEKPLRLSQWKNRKTYILAGSMSVMGCLGFTLYEKNGLNFRFNQSDATTLAIRKILNDPLPRVKQAFSCNDVIPALGKIQFNYCELTKKQDPDILFIGDSHTMHYQNALWEQFPSQSVLMIVEMSCLPFATNYLLKGACSEKYAAIMDYLTKNKSIKKVYLSAYWAYLMTGEFGDIGPNWHRAKPFNAVRAKSFLENGRYFIGQIAKTNKEIIFLKDIPDFNFNINTCFDIRPFRLHQINKQCAINLANHKARMQPYNQILTRLLQDFPAVKVYDPSPLFCKKNKCIARDQHYPFYMNGDHLNYYGAHMVIADLLSTFEKIA